MPTYRYRCSKCGEEFEVWQSIKDPAITVHDTCNGALLKVMTPAGIVLKGSGFYKTDSRSGSGSRTSTSGNGTKDEHKKGEGKKDGATKSEHSSGSVGSGSGDSTGNSTSSPTTPTKDSSGASSSGSTSST